MLRVTFVTQGFQMIDVRLDTCFAIGYN